MLDLGRIWVGWVGWLLLELCEYGFYKLEITTLKLLNHFTINYTPKYTAFTVFLPGKISTLAVSAIRPGPENLQARRAKVTQSRNTRVSGAPRAIKIFQHVSTT